MKLFELSLLDTLPEDRIRLNIKMRDRAHRFRARVAKRESERDVLFGDPSPRYPALGAENGDVGLAVRTTDAALARTGSAIGQDVGGHGRK